jgi:hypothetical protein
LNDPIGQSGLAMVDVGDDGKIADMVQGNKKGAFSAPWGHCEWADSSGNVPGIHALSTHKKNGGKAVRLPMPKPAPIHSTHQDQRIRIDIVDCHREEN